MVSESWFHALLKTPRKRKASPQKAMVGVLTFEVASLMSKLIHLWRFLSDGQISRLREEISNSVGLKKLVSDDDEHIVSLLCAELVQNLTQLAKSVARLGRKCSDPGLKSFEHVLSDLIENGNTPYDCLFSFKKMESKVKKMERFISVASSLYQETETLSDLERTLRRMRVNENMDKVTIVEVQKKVARKRRDLKNLRELSLWNRTYDYTVLLLARSLFTVFIRIKHVFGIEEMVDGIPRSQSVAALLQSFLVPTKNGRARFASGPLRKSNIKSGKFSKGSNFVSGSVGGSVTVSGPLSSLSSRKDRNVNFYSGPLRKASAKSGRISETDKNGKNLWLSGFLSPYGNSKKLHPKPNRLTQVEPLKGPAISSYRSPTIGRRLNFNGFHTEILDGARDSSSDLIDPCTNADLSKSSFNFKSRLLNYTR